MISRRALSRFIPFILIILSVQRAFAINPIADDPQNKRWHYSEKASTATFLGADKPEPAIVLLDKQACIGLTMTIETDGTYLTYQSGDSPHMVFQPVAKPEGSISTLRLTGGDQPDVFFNDKEQIQQQGKWIEIFNTTDKTLKFRIENATFAKVKFMAPEAPKPAVVPQASNPRVSAPPEKEMLHTITAGKLLAVSNAFRDGVSKKCLLCNGSGNIKTRVQTGSQQQGIYSVPTFEDREVKCEQCHGSGILRVKDEALVRLSDTLVTDLAGLKEDDPKKQDSLAKAYASINDKMIGDHATWTLLTRAGKSILAQANPTVGTAVVSMVEVKKSIKLPNDHRRYLVRVIGTDREVFVDDPALADELKSGHALMGGVVAQPIPDEKGDGHTTALHGGFLVAPAVDKSKWWWFKEN